MLKKILTCSCLLTVFIANAITYTYSNLNNSAKTCTLASWGGMQPTSGKLVLKETYEADGVTYKVTAIAPHALDNLTEVTEITIPGNVTVIGQSGAEGVDSYINSCDNFYNCPKLERFKVATGNTAFAASGAGLLMTRGGATLLRVPMNLQVSDATLNMSASVTAIAPDAFAGNSTIVTLALSPAVADFCDGCGFSDMTSLETFKVNGSATTGSYSIVDGILFNKPETQLISYPPCRHGESYTLPSEVNVLWPYAFRNVKWIYKVLLNKVETIGYGAFEGSSITTLDIPASVGAIREGALRGCPRLVSLNIYARDIDIPEDFARDCDKLTTVQLYNGGLTIGENAFRGCSSLKNFTFSPSDTPSGRYAFSGCGFTEVVYAAGMMGLDGLDCGTGLFSDNPELTLLDFSNLEVAPTEPGQLWGLRVSARFADNCPKLKTVLLPAMTTFREITGEDSSNFGVNPSIERFVLGAFCIIDNPAVIYSGAGVRSPEMYVRMTEGADDACELRDFFKVTDGAVCKPRIYIDAYEIARFPTDDSYAWPGGEYYVPGDATANYPAVTNRGGTVSEMYSIATRKENGMLALTLHPLVEGLEFTRILANDGNIALGLPDESGNLVTPIAYDHVSNLTLRYTVNGVEMTTVYPSANLGGVTEIAADTAEWGLTVEDGLVTFPAGAAYSVTDINGRKLAAGTAASVDLTRLPAGVYIISAVAGDGTSARRKIILD